MENVGLRIFLTISIVLVIFDIAQQILLTSKMRLLILDEGGTTRKPSRWANRIFGGLAITGMVYLLAAVWLLEKIQF